ncbi:MAG: carboxypeptidase regulatory-like domain-containing protein [Acidobacteriota bacterium]
MTALAVLAILVGTLTPLTIRLMDDQRTHSTLTTLDNLKRAVSGSPVVIIDEARTAFGYLGDMGNLPSTLEDLWILGTQPNFTFNSTLKAGAGWNGPYLEAGVISYLESLDRDAWGRTLIYSTGSFTDAETGAAAEGKIASLGPDGVAGTNDDLTLLFFKTEIKSRVLGFIKDDKTNPVAGASVTINLPQNGTLTTVSVFTNSDGFYQFTDIPYGNRSITIEPKLVLAPDTALVKGANLNNIEFVVKNFSNQDITISTFKAIYTSSPQAFYETLKIKGRNKFNSNNPRAGSDTLIDFSGDPETITGSGALAESFPIRIQSPTTEVEDLIIGKIGKGGSAKVEMLNFRDAATGNAAEVDMTGVTFEVHFSDGSIIIFTPTVV